MTRWRQRRAHSQNGVADRRRVVLFTNSVAVGGMEQHVVLLARYLDRSKFEVFGIVPDWKPTLPFTESLRKEADRVDTITPDRRYGQRRQLTEAIRLTRCLRSWRIDTIHMHSTSFRGQRWPSVRPAGRGTAGVRDGAPGPRPEPAATDPSVAKRLHAVHDRSRMCLGEEPRCQISPPVYAAGSRRN